MKFQTERVSQIKSSPSMAVSMLAKKMKAEGEHVIDLSLGEPDFNTPANIIDAAERAMKNGMTRYTGPDGLPALREAIVNKFKRENGLDYAVSEITVANGAKQIIFNAFLATLEEGDEVLVPAPYWVSYTDMALLNGGVPCIVECGVEDGFKLSPQRLESAITSKTRWLLLNSPSNPSGAIYTHDELAALGKVLEQHPHVMVMSDEIYEHIVVGETPFVSFVSACPTLRDRTLIINGVSKAYAMTGWRLGYAAGPQGLITALNKMQSQTTTCPSVISQAASVEALNGPQTFVHEAVKEYKVRGELVASELAKIPGLELLQPQGAFYAFPKCAAYIGKKTPDGHVIANDAELSSYLLSVGKVATVPGSAFGIEPYIRLSTATSLQNLQMAVKQIRDALGLLA